ncbi:hypothetical protein P0F40_000389 [Vibrio metschnikovii]|nr:hypothetical protein [Vibrio metschnikovii]
MKILYLMQVDWNWIKQRPHFIAEGLSKLGHEVVVYSPFSQSRDNLTDNNSEEIFNNYYFRMPYKIRNTKWFNWLSNITTKFQLPDFNNFDAVFITYPEQVEWIPSKFQGKIIYDCMDDHTEFEGIDVKKLLDSEVKLCELSSIITFSSENLSRVVRQRTGVDTLKCHLIRNGLSNSLDLEGMSEWKEYNRKIAYIGTISEWIDNDILLSILDEFEDTVIDMIGPITIERLEHPRINYLGAIPHEQLKSIVTGYGAFIMPFQVNELIKSVDPVKLYEYIFFGRAIITCHYPEIERFSYFVNFYHDNKSVVDIINKLSHGSTLSISKEERYKFLYNNTWSSRVEKFDALLREMMSK